MSGRLIQSVLRTLNILELFRQSEYELSIKEISTRLILAKSTVHGLVQTLVTRGYLEQNPENQKYKLGLRLFELGLLVQNSMDIRRLAHPEITKLSKMVKETVHLVIWNGFEAMYIEKIIGPTALGMSSQVGRRARLHCTGVGKAILAFLDDLQQQQILSTAVLEPLTPRSITDPELLRKELAQIKQQGYSIDDEEIEIGLKCIAAPIFKLNGEVVGSISCSGPKRRMSAKTIEKKLIEHVKTSALRISMQMGYKFS